MRWECSHQVCTVRELEVHNYEVGVFKFSPAQGCGAHEVGVFSPGV